MTSYTSKWSRVFAIFFIIVAITCIVYSLKNDHKATILIGASTSFATIAGAILVFSTLDVQHKALKVEINKNDYSRFDSRFYSILSSFRMDAANMENTIELIREKGKEYGSPYSSSYNGEKAFFINRKIVETLYTYIRKDSFEKYNSEDIRIKLEEIRNTESYILENWATEEDLDKIYDKRITFLHSKQVGFLLYKYGITEEIWKKLNNADEEVLTSFLLDKLLTLQPAILTKYIQTLRFLIRIIDDSLNDKDKKDYFQNITCQLGKEELLFLKTFKEFNKVACIQ